MSFLRGNAIPFGGGDARMRRLLGLVDEAEPAEANFSEDSQWPQTSQPTTHDRELASQIRQLATELADAKLRIIQLEAKRPQPKSD